MDSKEPTIFEKDIEEPIDKVSTAAERIIVRRLDYLYVMPFIAMISFLQFLDTLTINYASVLGILSDTNTTNDQFGFVGSVLYIGALIAQIPTAFFIHKFPPKKCLGVLVILWGSVLMLISLAKSYSHLVVLRFVLGLFETSANPCCVMIVNRMYRRNEQAGRVNFIVLGSALALTFGGLIGYGIGHMNDVRGIHSWQWLMIILGSFTVLWGILLLFFMVDDPKSKTLGLTPEQEKIVDLRILDNAVVVSKKINYDQIKECLKEPRYYCYVLVSIFTNLQTGSLQTFSSIIISNFGYSGLDAILLGIPSGVMKILFSVVGAWFVGRYGHLHYTMFATHTTTSLGILLLITIPVNKAKLVGLYLAMISGFGMTLIFTTITNNVAGYTKKIFYVSSAVASITTGKLIGPLLMVDSQKPVYLGAMITYIVLDSISILLLWVCRHNMSKINAKRLNNPTDEMSDKEDPTDVENHNYIYKL
ncbi:MFS general substrate transporter [Backusella circina FSU 941]|nr:MFS general substrate transporter [Backusella circina FSU 941]